MAFIAVMFITPDSLFIRLSNVETWSLVFYRGIIPFGLVFVGMLLIYKLKFFNLLRSNGYYGCAYVLTFSVTNVAFVVSIQNTNVANTLIMIATAPMLSAILGSLFLKENPDKKTWIAIFITFFAALYIFYDSIKLGNFFGDILGFVAAMGLAVGAVIIRSAKKLNLVPSAVVGKLIIALFAIFFVKDYSLNNNDIYIVPRGSLAQPGQSQNMSVYSPSGTGITQTTNVSGGGQSGAIQVGNMLAIVDTMSISSFTNPNAGKWLQINSTDSNVWKNTTSFGTDGGDTYYASGNIPHTLTTHTTNKALAFGFAQKAGTAGDTIPVLPFTSNSLEKNQSSLTDGTKYYVSSTGALTTVTTPDSDINADPNNPFVGEAVGTTRLRLPTRSDVTISGDARIFCGSYDFRVDGSSTAQNVLISLPSGYTAADVRAYEINYYGIGFAADGNHFTFKPYNGSSSILSGNTVYMSIFSAYDSSDRVQTSKAVSAGFPLQRGDGTARDAYSGNDVDNPKQNYDNTSGHGGQLNGRAIYTNSLKNGSYDYSSTWRWGSSATNHAFARGIVTLGNGNSTTNYADGFYFYIGDDSQSEQSTAIMEGVVSVYAIIG